MIDTNELRRLAQAALAGPDGISLNWIKLLQDFQQKANPAAISELLSRLEAVENKLETERMRLAACSVAALGYFDGCAKEYTSASLDDVLNLCKRLEAAEKERDALRASKLPEGLETDLFIVEHAMRMNNWDWNSDTSDDLKRSAYKIISELLAATPKPEGE